MSDAKVLAETSRRLLEKAKNTAEQAKVAHGDEKAVLEQNARTLLEEARRIANTAITITKK